MKIGLTYDLRDDYHALGYSPEETAEFDSLETIDALDGAIQALGFQTQRIGHIRALAARLVAGERWDLVFNVCEGLKGRSREAQVPALLEAYDIPYVFSDPLTAAVTLDKGIAKDLVRAAGLPTAPHVVLAQPGDENKIGFGYPCFVKPLAEGTGKGCERASKVSSKSDLVKVARQIRARFHQPAIAEPFLPGREFTVGVVGNGASARIIAVLEIGLKPGAEAEVYSYTNKENCEALVTYRLADDGEARQAGQVALAAYRVLGCRDASRLDLRSDALGQPQFLEVNPLAGLHPTHSDLPVLALLSGVSYHQLMGEIISAALIRTGLKQVQARKVRRAA